MRVLVFELGCKNLIYNVVFKSVLNFIVDLNDRVRVSVLNFIVDLDDSDGKR